MFCTSNNPNFEKRHLVLNQRCHWWNY